MNNQENIVADFYAKLTTVGPPLKVTIFYNIWKWPTVLFLANSFKIGQIRLIWLFKGQMATLIYKKIQRCENNLM